MLLRKAPGDSDPKHDAIHERLQQVGPNFGEKKATVLTAWVVVSEWMDEDGLRWLSRSHSASLTNWAANGLHHEALYGDWSPNDADEAEDED